MAWKKAGEAGVGEEKGAARLCCWISYCLGFVYRVMPTMLSRRRERYRDAARREARQPGEIQTPRVCVERVEAADVSTVLLCEDPVVLESLRFIKAGARRCLQVEDVAEHVRVAA